MMSAPALFVYLVCLCAWSYAAVSIERANPNKDHPGHCYTENENLGAFEKLERKQIPGQCVVAECRSNGDIAYASCGVIKIQEPCQALPGDVSKPYPDCCFVISCP